MYFRLIDQILDLKHGKKIVATKAVSLAEEYLRDHFPLFPVLPGVLMLEAMYQASAWLIRSTDDFRHGMVVLKEAKNVRYADFVKPGQLLVISATIQKREAACTWLQAQGTVQDRLAVSAKLTLESFDLDDQNGKDGTNEFTRQSMLAEYRQLMARDGSPV
ncbi:MAG: beta-hydroxyacyl-ACP dehydratase [Planctomycetota bacterium]|nr:beta-hydroxyacyl-ACP dehydratase [Planctomycetota bacterium]MDA1179904.1 beta-hydroxyacyl-ACP dehydratase [Planctomycetota bacterium]